MLRRQPLRPLALASGRGACCPRRACGLPSRHPAFPRRPWGLWQKTPRFVFRKPRKASRKLSPCCSPRILAQLPLPSPASHISSHIPSNHTCRLHTRRTPNLPTPTSLFQRSTTRRASAKSHMKMTIELKVVLHLSPHGATLSYSWESRHFLLTPMGQVMPIDKLSLCKPLVQIELFSFTDAFQHDLLTRAFFWTGERSPGSCTFAFHLTKRPKDCPGKSQL